MHGLTEMRSWGHGWLPCNMAFAPVPRLSVRKEKDGMGICCVLPGFRQSQQILHVSYQPCPINSGMVASAIRPLITAVLLYQGSLDASKAIMARGSS